MNTLKAKSLMGTVLVLTALVLNSCAALKLDNAQTQLRTSFASGDYTQAALLIEQLDRDNIYQSKDQVLFNLEAGLTNHFAGNYELSSTHFSDAELIMEELYSKSISRAIKSFLINDNALDYDGEDYEDIYLNIFKGLNYIHLNDYESALVETRRVTFKLGQLDQKYNGLLDALSKADTTNTGESKWQAGKTNFQNSALARYLSTILYAKTRKPDDARIEYENLLQAFNEQPDIYAFNEAGKEDFKILTEPDQYNVLIQTFTGRAPIKTQNDVRFYLDESDTYLKFSLPELSTFNSSVDYIEVEVDSSSIEPLYLIEEMDRVAEEVYKVKEPIIYARAIVRSFLKTLAAKKMEQEADDEDETLGFFVGLVGDIAKEATEKADLRSWQTMPGKAHANVMNLPAGPHVLHLNYYDQYDNLIYQDVRNITIQEEQPLKLIESIYWN